MIEPGESMLQISAVVYGQKPQGVDPKDRVVYDLRHWLLAPNWAIQSVAHEHAICFEAWVIDRLGNYMDQIRSRDDILGKFEFCIDVNASIETFFDGFSEITATLATSVSYMELIGSFGEFSDRDLRQRDLFLRLNAAVERHL